MARAARPSDIYLDGAGRNLARNGFTGAAHKRAQADTIAWLEACRGSLDLVFDDPPTFSNSKRAEDFDLQRDHVRQLQLCGEHLAPDGVIAFHNNVRRFRLDAGALAGFEVREITCATIPPDFARDQKIHQPFERRLR